MNNCQNRRPAARLAVAAGAVLGLLSLSATASSFHGAEAAPHKTYHAIFQIDSGSSHIIKKTLNNIENLLHDPRLQGHIKIELIANSKGINVYMKNNGLEKKLRHLQGEGVILAQCNNTLHELHVARKELYPFVSIVPSGVGEITLREAQGWAYIHPSTPPSNNL